MASAAAQAAAESNSMFATAMDSITVEEVFEHVEVLADDIYEGRAAGSRGGRAASQYLVRELQQYGFTPAGTDGSYIQSFGADWRNVLALQPGDDPDVDQEVIVVGAHYDHVGYGNRRNSFGPFGRIHNGADDNASGVAVLLETMEAFADSGLRTRRSILFAFWDGEERGLVGSRHWMANPTLAVAGISDPGHGTADARQHIQLAVTVDMVGRLREGRLYVLGTRSGYGLRRLMSGLVSGEKRGASSALTPPFSPRSLHPAPGLWLDFSWELSDNSDHWSFLERGIPVVLLHTGLHRDYHRPSDDVEKVNRQGMRDVSRYLLATIIRLANEDRLPTFRPAVTRETDGGRRTLERPLPPASLADWPADLSPPRLGISWRDDEAEPGSVFLTRVVDGSPADAAALAVHDRIYKLNDQPFADAAAFQAAITTLLDSNPNELTLLIERRGQMRTVIVRMTSDDEGRQGEAESGRQGDS